MGVVEVKAWKDKVDIDSMTSVGGEIEACYNSGFLGTLSDTTGVGGLSKLMMQNWAFSSC
jgi:hypothetical protein